MTRAVFLDRDGTINTAIENIRSANQLRILPGAAAAIKKLNRAGFLAIVITNQPIVARGLITEKKLDFIHAVLVKRLGKNGAKLDAIYYCPHHPNANLQKYRVRCRCRKPNTGLIKQAIKRFHINSKKSFMVGDTMPDIVVGKRAKLKTILVKTGGFKNHRGYNTRPNFVVKNLPEAVKTILRNGK